MVKDYTLMIDIKKYIEQVKKDVNINKVLLFGSYARNNATENSDVDLAIISEEFDKAPLLEKVKLYQLRHRADIHYDIQPVPVGLDEYNNCTDFFIKEIRATAIDLTDEIV